MDEPDEHASLDLFDGVLLDEVGTDAPVLLGGIDGVVVDPTGARCLQQRVVEEEAELPTGSQHPGDLGDRTVDVVDVFEHEAGDHGVERSGGERERGRFRSGVVRSPAAFVSHPDLVPRRIDADHPRAGSSEHPADLPVTAPEVEDPIESCEFGAGERQDLLDVLRIGALGEALDPPVGVYLPQLVIRWFSQPGNHGGVGGVRHDGRGYGRTMKFSIWPNPERPPAEVLDLARLADSEGWFGMWFADHYMPNTGSESIQPGDVHECWAMLPAIAAVTERIRIGPLVSPTSVHHPAVLANRAATIDHISNGRMVLGVGAGWQINEHHAYGIELQEPGPRVTRFDEAIQIIRSLMANERTDFSGEYYEIIDAPADPKPVQSPLPILVGTGSPRMLRITARYADEWNTWGAPDMAGGALDKLHTACKQVDRDPSTIWKSAQALVFMTDNEEFANNIKGGDMGERSIIGSNDRLVDEIGRYAELGFDEVIVPDFTLGGSSDERVANYRQFSAEVAVHFT